MGINPAIKSILEENGVDYQDGLTYLLCVYYDVYPSFIPDSLKRLVNDTKIVVLTSEDITWQIPLFDKEVDNSTFSWVITEYVALFKNIGKGTHGKESIKRMKKFFATYPDVRKDEVIDATVMYLQNTNRTYVRNPHYFIFKGSGYAMTSDLYAWVETLRQERKELENRSNSIQLQ